MSLRSWFIKNLLRRVALAEGFVDPIQLMGRLRRFAQPSEVQEPVELLRAGVLFHARGLLNTKAIQHNLDWVWPYWVEEQFDPLGPSFIPRAFSVTHINLTHRNWTAVGLPNCGALPIVDPRGMCTPTYDGWSLDGWVVDDAGESLYPSRADRVDQHLEMADEQFGVATRSVNEAGLELLVEARVEGSGGSPVCVIRYTASAPRPGWLAVSVRPYNPEGVSLVERIEYRESERAWHINGKHRVLLEAAPERVDCSIYSEGDVSLALGEDRGRTDVHCPAGMATSAALYRVDGERPTIVDVRVPLDEEHEPGGNPTHRTATSWAGALEGAASLRLPDSTFETLFESALRTLVLLTPGDVFPGPYTYKRFWFRDAAFILSTMDAVGLGARVEPILARFPDRQKARGYFRSQDGEWDSNGEALWTMYRHHLLAGTSPPASWQRPVAAGVEWIQRMRIHDPGGIHHGLMPAGFSAEHLGPNDFYFWDDFWCVAGLNAAAWMHSQWGNIESARSCRAEAEDFEKGLDTCLRRTRERLGRPAIPAAPTRRLDAGCIGSLVAGYPLQLVAPTDERLLDTAEFLYAHCRVGGGFFQDMIHSGINAYLTLHLAQVFLRAGDERFFELIRIVADLASPTGQWPEAIHPQTGGGCMGDGQHAWAAAEWIMMMRNLFVQEEADRLVLCGGIPPAWTDSGADLSFGPTATPYGPLSVFVEAGPTAVRVRWTADWRTPPARLEIALPGTAPVSVDPRTQDSVEVRKP